MFNKKIKDRWENVYIKGYNIHYSRIIASFMNAGGDVSSKKFREWLRHLTNVETGERILTEDQVADIYSLANDGKLEWETDAREWLSKR